MWRDALVIQAEGKTWHPSCGGWQSFPTPAVPRAVWTAEPLEPVAVIVDRDGCRVACEGDCEATERMRRQRDWFKSRVDRAVNVLRGVGQ